MCCKRQALIYFTVAKEQYSCYYHKEVRNSKSSEISGSSPDYHNVWIICKMGSDVYACVYFLILDTTNFDMIMINYRRLNEEDSTDKVANQVKSERVKRIHNRVCKVRMNEEVGVKYMQAWEEKYYEREKGRSEGREEGTVITLVKLVCKKMKKGFKPVEIADILEEPEEMIQRIYDIAVLYAPGYDAEKIMEKLQDTACRKTKAI